MWFLFRHNSRHTKSVRRTPSTIRPRLEVLEDRCLMSAGALDPTFGNGAGYVTSSLTNSNDTGGSTVIEPNGTLILCGQIETTKGAKHTFAVGLTAYNPDGSLDTAFGTGGKVIGPAGLNGAVVSVLYPSTDPNGNGGKFLVTGLSGFAIARYNRVFGVTLMPEFAWPPAWDRAWARRADAIGSPRPLWYHFFYRIQRERDVEQEEPHEATFSFSDQSEGNLRLATLTRVESAFMSSSSGFPGRPSGRLKKLG